MNMIYRVVQELNYKEDEVYVKEYIWLLRWLDFFNEKSLAENDLKKKQDKQNRMKH